MRGYTMTNLGGEQINTRMILSSRIDINGLLGIVLNFTAPVLTRWDVNDQPVFNMVLLYLSDKAPLGV